MSGGIWLTVDIQIPGFRLTTLRRTACGRTGAYCRYPQEH
jgi:hypothetical protein